MKEFIKQDPLINKNKNIWVIFLSLLYQRIKQS